MQRIWIAKTILIVIHVIHVFWYNMKFESIILVRFLKTGPIQWLCFMSVCGIIHLFEHIRPAALEVVKSGQTQNILVPVYNCI